MRLIKTIWNGLKQGLRFRKLAFFILLIQLLLATLIGILSYNYVQGSIGQTTNLLKIIEGYDHDVFQDLLRFESTGWIMIKTFTVVVIVLYLVIGPFIMGGTLHVFKENQDSWDTFWCGGSKFYLSFLKLNLLILFFLILFLALFGFAAFLLSNYGLQNFKSEVPIFWSVGLLILLYLMIGILLISISTQAKWELLKEQNKVLKVFRLGLSKVWNKAFFYLSLGFVFLLISIAFIFLMNFIINCVPESGFLLVILALILQILSLYIKVCLRNGYYNAIINS
jgi:hypothetical protein